MPVRGFGKVGRGQSAKSADANRAFDALAALSLVEGSGGLLAGWSGDAIQINDPRAPGFWVRITGAGSGNAYPWVRVGETTSTFPDDKTYTGATTSLPAYEVNGRTDVAADTKHWATPSPGMASLTFSAAVGGDGDSVLCIPYVHSIACSSGVLTVATSYLRVPTWLGITATSTASCT